MATDDRRIIGCSLQADTNSPHLAIEELAYTIGDGPIQIVTSGDTITVVLNQSLCMHYVTYSNSDLVGSNYGVWVEGVIRKDDWDEDDARAADAFSSGVENETELRVGPGCWDTVAETWRELTVWNYEFENSLQKRKETNQ